MFFVTLREANLPLVILILLVVRPFGDILGKVRQHLHEE